MKKLDTYLIEKLKIGKTTKHQYNYFPQNKTELQKIIIERLAKDNNADLNDIDVSKITNMNNLFYGFDLDPHNIDISEWDVSNVTDMRSMFYLCEKFDCDLNGWDVSKVEDMEFMFYGCKKFKGKGLENWKVSKVEDMSNMFKGCTSLKNKPNWYKE